MTPRLKRIDAAPAPGIVHIGPGAFFRSFVADYTLDAIASGGGNWGIVAVSLCSTTAHDQLVPQGCAFTSISLTNDRREARINGSIVDVLVADEDPIAVIDAMSDPDIKIVSLTITEKGYDYDPMTDGLDLSSSRIAEDLANPKSPESAVGLIVAALEARRRNGVAPFTVLSCDNLPSNGEIAKAVVLDFARRLAPDLAEWIAANGAFPSTMVDRITPATTEADIEGLKESEGYFDPACVVHEDFRQWVIEDSFVQDHPKWENAGALFVADVSTHEKMKLRCLNGTHSALAYLGYLAGIETVSDAANDPTFSEFCRILWKDEILPTLQTPEGQSLPDYCETLLARYRNPSIRHKLWQIAMDGSQKLPQRILSTVSERLEAGAVPQGLCLSVAAWMRYVGGMDESGQPIDVRDPMLNELSKATGGQGVDVVGNLLDLQEIFGSRISENADFRSAVANWYKALCADGAQKTVATFVAGQPGRR